MDHAKPGLFELPDPEPQAPRQRRQRGRNRETWARTATAELSIIDAAAVDEAARAEANAVTIGSSADSGVEDPSRRDAGDEPAARALDQLARLIWPTDGLEALMAADAFRIVSVECEVVGESADRGHGHLDGRGQAHRRRTGYADWLPTGSAAGPSRTP